MPVIQPSQQPAYWIISALELDGVTAIGQVTAVNNALTVISAEGEIAFVTAAQGVQFTPLPAAGTWLEAGKIYGYGGGCVIVRQSHYRTSHNPADVPALFCVYRADAGSVLDWVAGESVTAGTRRRYDDQDYECLQAHVTQSDWTPPAVPALWRVIQVTPPTSAWAYPVAYAVNAVVTYAGKTYRCRQAHTSQAGWTPPVVPALWEEIV